MEANKLLNAVIEQRDLGAFNSPSRPKPKKLGHRATNSQDRSEEGFFFFFPRKNKTLENLFHLEKNIGWRI